MLEGAIFFNEQPRAEMRAFVTAHADYQTKYLVHGGPVERWPQPIKTTPATPELLRSAATTLSFFELVGRTEELGAFVARLAALLGVTPPSGGSSSSGSNGGDAPAKAAAPMLGQAPQLAQAPFLRALRRRPLLDAPASDRRRVAVRPHL